MTCAKFWHNLIIIFHARVLHISTRSGLWAHKPFVKWVPKISLPVVTVYFCVAPHTKLPPKGQKFGSLLHSPSLMASRLSMGYETWTVIGWAVFTNDERSYVIVTMCYGIMWLGACSILFQRPQTVCFKAQHQTPVVRAVRRDWEIVYKLGWGMYYQV